MTAAFRAGTPLTAEREDIALPLVSARGLTKDFGGDRGLFGRAETPLRAVDEVSLDIARGEVLGVVGESGSGKSTLGRLLLRLIEPTAGSITFDGQDVSAMVPRDLRQFRRNMQMIFQDPYASLNARMTVGDALIESLMLHRELRRSEAKDAAASLLSKVGLTREHLGRYPRAFSGGQRQRVAIARALASQPGFIVADEPVSALDVSIQAEVINLLQDLQRELGLSLMFISHDLSVVEIMSDRVMVLYLGRIMEIGADGGPLRPPSASLHGDPDAGRPRSEAPRRATARNRRDPKPAQSSFGLRLPNPLPFRHSGLRRGWPARLARDRAGPFQGMHS